MVIQGIFQGHKIIVKEDVNHRDRERDRNKKEEICYYFACHTKNLMLTTCHGVLPLYLGYREQQ